MRAYRLLFIFVVSVMLLGLPLFFGTSKQANAEPICETFWYSDAREVFAMIWEPGEAALYAAQDAINWFNLLITGDGDGPLVVDEQMRIIVAFRDRSNGRWLSEANILFEGDMPGPTLGLIVYDEDAKGMTIVVLPYTTFDVEYNIKRKRKDSVTSVSYERKITGVQGDLGVKALWIQLEPSTLPEAGEDTHTTPTIYYRHHSIDPHMLRLVTSRRTQYFLVDDGIPTENLDEKIRFWADFSEVSHPEIDYQALFGDPGNVLVRASFYMGEDILYTCGQP